MTLTNTAFVRFGGVCVAPRATTSFNYHRLHEARLVVRAEPQVSGMMGISKCIKWEGAGEYVGGNGSRDNRPLLA